ncbi:hypothetical protein [Amycolatopsis samaneae]|uniref:Uncharacterized protein n=1 Tax=Amycolatopsis samaneae TaxID=664691 RepID=A0ABW5G7J1_9PSEU
MKDQGPPEATWRSRLAMTATRLDGRPARLVVGVVVIDGRYDVALQTNDDAPVLLREAKPVTLSTLLHQAYADRPFCGPGADG